MKPLPESFLSRLPGGAPLEDYLKHILGRIDFQIKDYAPSSEPRSLQIKGEMLKFWLMDETLNHLGWKTRLETQEGRLNIKLGDNYPSTTIHGKVRALYMGDGVWVSAKGDRVDWGALRRGEERVVRCWAENVLKTRLPDDARAAFMKTIRVDWGVRVIGVDPFSRISDEDRQMAGRVISVIAAEEMRGKTPQVSMRHPSKRL